MGLFSNFPYSDFENLNLDWIINKVKEYILKYDNLEGFVNKSIEDQNKLIAEALKEIAEGMDNLREYIITNLETIANNIINELIESGTLYVGTNYNQETEELNIILTREEV